MSRFPKIKPPGRAVRFGATRIDWIYTMAQERSALYGMLSILVALTAGWLASAAFRMFFR